MIVAVVVEVWCTVVEDGVVDYHDGEGEEVFAVD